MKTISQWKKEGNQLKHIGGDWQEETVNAAMETIKSLKISGANSIFIIEDEGGTVLEVIKTDFPKWEPFQRTQA